MPWFRCHGRTPLNTRRSARRRRAVEGTDHEGRAMMAWIPALPGATAAGSLEAFVLLFRTLSAAAALRAESFNSELKGTSTMLAD